MISTMTLDYHLLLIGVVVLVVVQEPMVVLVEHLLKEKDGGQVHLDVGLEWRLNRTLTNIDSHFSDTENRSTGILRNSINRQDTYGLISKLNYDVSDELEVQVGIDWRTLVLNIAREVRDLLGGDYYVDFRSDDNAF